MLAYVTSTTNVSLIRAMQQRKIRIMADASESMRNNGLLYNRDFYRARIGELKLNILITDFPVDVSDFLK